MGDLATQPTATSEQQNGTAAAAATTAPPAAQTQPATNDAEFKAPGSAEELDAMIRDRIRRAETQAAKAAADKAKQDFEAEATRKSAEQQGQFQTLYEAEQQKVADHATEIERLKGEIATRDRNALRDKVAAKHNLPQELWERLIGEDEKSLEEDAKRLAGVVQVKAPNTEGGAGSKPSKGAHAPAQRGGYTFRRGTPIVPFPGHERKDA